MVDPSDAFFDKINSSQVQIMEVMTDASLMDGDKQDSLGIDQQEAQHNLNRGLLAGAILGETTSFSNRVDSLGILEGLASINSLPYGSSGSRATDSDTHERSQGLEPVLHSAFVTQHGSQQVTPESENSGFQRDQLSTSGQTPVLLDQPAPASAGIENEDTEVIYPATSIANAAGSPIFNSQPGMMSFLTTETGTGASASLAHSSSGGTGPAHSGVSSHVLESADDDNDDDDEAMISVSEHYYDDSDCGAFDNEGNPVFPPNLIEDSDLARFCYEKLPGVPSIFSSTKSMSDDSGSEINDAEKFYITDDELSWCDPAEYSSASFTFGSDLRGGQPHQGQVQSSTAGGRAQPLSFTNFENISGQSFTLNTDADDDDHLDLGTFTQTESMDSYFISPTYTLFLPLNTHILGKAQQIIHHEFDNMKPLEYSPGPFINLSREFPPSADCVMLQAASNFFSQISTFVNPFSGIFIFCDAHNAFFVNDTTITFLSGLEMTDSFLKPHDHTQDSPHLIFCHVLLRSMTSASSSVTPHSRRIAAVTRPGGLLSEEQYAYIHGPSEESIYFVPPSLVLKFFSAHIASILLASPLAPCGGHTYTLADGLEFPAFEKNLTIDMFIKQWLIRSKIPAEQLPLKDRLMFQFRMPQRTSRFGRDLRR
ncbi:hypothetical protein ACJ72_04822 [Emergomyces africanus]|uniref:Uncharacterized protein n=1 Tax=Emergomyces africanus TaxID=1955775 RepID=A0A1B7NVN6_9EURO|nr:hypothetical protein ACJ72_04822 [Emergomyces africanus]